MVKTQPDLPLRTLSKSVVIQQHGSVSMSVAHATSKDHEDVTGLGCFLGTMLISQGCAELAQSLTVCYALES